MITALDCHYTATTSACAACAIAQWGDSAIAAHQRITLAGVAEYVPGSFYQRELPPILALLRAIPWPVTCLMVDGYVELAAGAPGLGARLWEAWGRQCPVIGVAKTHFRGADTAVEITRGASLKPLYVTAIGIDRTAAAQQVRDLPGEFRIPHLLATVDRYVRSGVYQEPPAPRKSAV